MVGFHDLVGTDFAPVSNKTADRVKLYLFAAAAFLENCQKSHFLAETDRK